MFNSLDSLLLSSAAGTSGCGCRSSTQTFPKVPRLLSQYGTSTGRVEPSLLEEPLSPSLANMGESASKTLLTCLKDSLFCYQFETTASRYLSTHMLLYYSSMFRQGMHDLKVWPGVEGNGGESTTTPGRTSSSLTEDQMGRLAKVQ